MMAGGGKSITAGSFIHKYQSFYKFVLIVRKRNLVEQLASDALDTFGLDYGVFMAGHIKLDLTKSIQVCSKDTMKSRDTFPFEGEDNVVVMIDECDEFPEFQREIIKRYSVSKRFFYFGMTATPFNKLDMYDVCIEPITPRELLKKKILVDFKYYIPVQHDLSDIEINNGVFKSSDVSKKFDNPKAIKESFSAWLQYGDNRQTLIFCSNKEHSKRVVDYINSYYGKVVAAHCDADTPQQERRDAIKNFKLGILLFLSNIRLFGRGTDIPEIGCILDLALTLSLNNHIQKLGRGSRQNPIYLDCIVIDYVNNLLNNGHFYQDREVDLSSNYKKGKKDIEVQAMRVCSFCFRAAESWKNNICCYCGKSNAPVKKKKMSEYAKKKIFLATASEEQIEQRQMIKDYNSLLWKRRNLGKRYQYDIARQYAHFDLIKKYGLVKVLKVRNAVKLSDETIEEYKRRYEYVPLGGL